MALPYTITLTGSASWSDLGSLGIHGSGAWTGRISADRVTFSGESSATEFDVRLDVVVDAIGDGDRIDLNVGGPFTVNLDAELGAARLLIQSSDGATEYWRGVPGSVDADGDPYELSGSASVAEAFLRGVTARNGNSTNSTLRCRFEEASSPVDADLGTVALPAPTATLSADVHGPLYADADLGTVALPAPTASLSAEPAEDPVDADLGTVTLPAPTAGLSVDIVSAEAVDADLGTVTLPAPTATLRIQKRDAAVDADLGTVALPAPTATLRIDKGDPAVDADLGRVALPAPTATLRIDKADHSVDANLGRVALPAPTATLALDIGDFGDDFTVDERAIAPAARILTCIEFDHPDLAAPLRLVNDIEDATVGGEVYMASRFEARLADDEKRRAPSAEIGVGNVGREMNEWVEASGGGAGGTARILQVLDVPGALPDWDLTLDIVGIAGDSQTVTISLGFDPLLGRPAVALRYDPQTAPGLF